MKLKFRQHKKNATLRLLCGLLPLLAGMASCSNIEDNGSLDGNKGQSSIHLSIGGIAEDGAETITRSREDGDIITGTSDLGNGLLMTTTFKEESESVTRATPEALTPEAWYRVIVYDNSGNYVTYKDYKQGATITDITGLSSGVTYTVVAWSFNSTTALPAITAGEQLSLSSAVLYAAVNTDLIYWTGSTGTMVAGSNTVSFVFSRKTNQVRVSFDATNLSQNITAVSGVTLSSFIAEMKLFDGSLLKNGSGTLLTLLPGSPLGGQTVTAGSYSTAMYNGGSPFTLNIGSITIGGVAYTNKSVTFNSALTAGKKYTLQINFKDVTTVPVGSAIFKGRKCMDVIQTAGSYRGSFPIRNDEFVALGGGSLSTQTYTFTPSGTVSNVRFIYKNTSGTPVTGISGDIPGSVTTPITATVTFNSNLVNLARGTLIGGTGSQVPLKADIYAIYFDGTGDKMIKASIIVKDQACCGAKLGTTENTWKPFMCHNLGADNTLDPFTPSSGIGGARYAFGNGSPAITQAQDLDNDNNGGWPVATWISMANTQFDGNDWANDPCPSDWRLPTNTELINVINNNTKSDVGPWTLSGYIYNVFTAGSNFGGDLLLPAAGYRPYLSPSTMGGILAGRGFLGAYWTNKAKTTNEFYILEFRVAATKTEVGTTVPGRHAMAVRCIAN